MSYYIYLLGFLLTLIEFIIDFNPIVYSDHPPLETHDYPHKNVFSRVTDKIM